MGALALGIADQDFVKFGTQHLIGRRHRFVPGIGKLEGLAALLMPWRNKFCGVFGHTDGAHLFAYAQFIQQGQVGWQQGFADVKTRMPRFFQQHHPKAFLRQQGRGG